MCRRDERLAGANGLFALDFSVAEFSAELQIPVLGEFLGFRQALFLGADAPVLTGKVSGALPEVAVRTLVDLNFAAEDRVLFWHLNPALSGRKCGEP